MHGGHPLVETLVIGVEIAYQFRRLEFPAARVPSACGQTDCSFDPKPQLREGFLTKSTTFQRADSSWLAYRPLMVFAL